MAVSTPSTPECVPEAPLRRRQKFRRLNIDMMREVAHKRGGSCLSAEYRNAHTPLLWRCAAGHEWWSKPVNVFHAESWCGVCAHAARAVASRHSLSDMQKLAASRGGECLSAKYVSALKPLRWRCESGHEWSAPANRIKNGHWCGKCAGLARGTIDAMRAMAAARGGKCLSSDYKGNKHKLLWRCEAGHEWWAVPNSISSGRWCSECGNPGNSIGERLCRAIMARMFRAEFPRTWPAWLVSNQGRRLELDGYAERLGIAFEYQGRHHYKPSGWHSPEAVAAQQERDRTKVRICHDRGVRLVVVPEFKPWTKLSGCIDQIEYAVLCAGLDIPRRWKRPTEVADVREWLMRFADQIGTPAATKGSDRAGPPKRDAQRSRASHGEPRAAAHGAGVEL